MPVCELTGVIHVGWLKIFIIVNNYIVHRRCWTPRRSRAKWAWNVLIFTWIKGCLTSCAEGFLLQPAWPPSLWRASHVAWFPFVQLILWLTFQADVHSNHIGRPPSVVSWICCLYFTLACTHQLYPGISFLCQSYLHHKHSCLCSTL